MSYMVTGEITELIVNALTEQGLTADTDESNSYEAVIDVNNPEDADESWTIIIRIA